MDKSQSASSYWSRMTPEERRTEMQRRVKVRRLNRAKKQSQSGTTDAKEKDRLRKRKERQSKRTATLPDQMKMAHLAGRTEVELEMFCRDNNIPIPEAASYLSRSLERFSVIQQGKENSTSVKEQPAKRGRPRFRFYVA